MTLRSRASTRRRRHPPPSIGASLILAAAVARSSLVSLPRGGALALAPADSDDAAGECGAGARADGGECSGGVGSEAPGLDGGDCSDEHESCGFWAERGECAKNPNYMRAHCRRACEVCVVPFSREVMEEEEMLLRLISEYGDPQEVEGSEAPATLHIVKQTVSYMKNFVHSPRPTHGMPERVRATCRNRHKLCSFWAAIGECENNPGFMVTKCAPSCRSCHKIDFETRCPPLEGAEPSLGPGELNAMFERIIATAPGNGTSGDDEGGAAIVGEEGSPRYTVTVHSRPSPVPDSQPTWDRERDREQPPWVVTFDNFLTEEECEHLIQLGYKNTYERSKDVGDKEFDGSYGGVVSSDRTSENAWCSDKSGCRQDDVVERVMRRMSDVLDIPPENSEDLQMLKYEVGQFYNIHHDYIPEQRDRQCGPRILTFFLYLSDVEKGGGTKFPRLKPPLTIMPKRGRALLWPSVLNSNPRDVDPRMYHEALPVEAGRKFGANAWYHLFDYLTPRRLSCT